MFNDEISKSLYYEQKRDNARENIIYQITKILKWFLELLIRGVKAMFVALVDALKMLLHF